MIPSRATGIRARVLIGEGVHRQHKARLVEVGGDAHARHGAAHGSALLIVRIIGGITVRVRDPAQEPVGGRSGQGEGRIAVNGLAPGRADHSGQQVLGAGGGGIVLEGRSAVRPVLDVGEQAARISKSYEPARGVLQCLQQPGRVAEAVAVTDGVFPVGDATDLPCRVQRIGVGVTIGRGLLPEAVADILAERVQEAGRLRDEGTAAGIEANTSVNASFLLIGAPTNEMLPAYLRAKLSDWWQLI